MNDIEHPYFKQFKGYFNGILEWQALSQFWQTVRENEGEGWFIYAVGETPPTTMASNQELNQFLEEVDKLLRRDHQEEYCGIVYADSREKPTFIKIFDPNNLGMVCGSSDNPPLPGWILSKLQPIDLPAAMPQTGSRRRWWQAIFSKPQN